MHRGLHVLLPLIFCTVIRVNQVDNVCFGQYFLHFCPFFFPIDIKFNFLTPSILFSSIVYCLYSVYCVYGVALVYRNIYLSTYASIDANCPGLSGTVTD